jgi:hypothetical protein
MSSPRADFDELMRRVDSGREFTHASYEPIFYLVFHPRDIPEVKRLMPGWTARLRNDGWHVEIFSQLQDLEAELKELQDELLRIATTWRPNRDDGVQITAAPLWRLFRHRGCG